MDSLKFREWEPDGANGEKDKLQIMQIMQVLTAYVREYSPWPPKDEQLLEATKKQPIDIHAALTVLGGDILGSSPKGQVSLMSTDLRWAYLVTAHLEKIDLIGAHLENADLWFIHLEGAFLWNANLRGARLWNADLRDADLTGADLQDARLDGADLRGAILINTNLTQDQLHSASIDEHTQLPEGLIRPAKS